MDQFGIVPATGKVVPIIVSIPHCGTAFPDDIVEEYIPERISNVDDTDWFVDQLYDFAPALGITMITAVNSRWVIDLNRDPDSKPLYSDGRIITALCPTTNFLGEPIYRDHRAVVAADEVARRKKNYYDPYHMEIQRLLDERKNTFGKVVLWDCHSIRQVVATIQAEKFPDLILGDADGRSAAPLFIDSVIANLQREGYSFSHNHPFKGGTITRKFGRPEIDQHALQLEMTKVNYMDDAEQAYDTARAERMRSLLNQTLRALIGLL